MTDPETVLDENDEPEQVASAPEDDDPQQFVGADEEDNDIVIWENEGGQ